MESEHRPSPSAGGRRTTDNGHATSAMRISELVKKTGVPKETIHFYIREGLLRKPRKSGTNAADYTGGACGPHPADQGAAGQFFPADPRDQEDPEAEPASNPPRTRPSPISTTSISAPWTACCRPRWSAATPSGKPPASAANGSRSWKTWGVITHAVRKNGEPVYSRDDIIIGRLMVDMDRLGFGPKDGYDPEELKRIADFIRDFVRSSHREYYQRNLEGLSSADLDDKGQQVR
ncbi:MAG: MerR family transcriptional regulator [Desulfomicrobium escambiense]|nr:MerR family transcriptional regulator [Desulfomicrobium escambiense]